MKNVFIECVSLKKQNGQIFRLISCMDIYIIRANDNINIRLHVSYHDVKTFNGMKSCLAGCSSEVENSLDFQET